MTTPLLEVRGVVRRYTAREPLQASCKPAVDGVDLTLAKGETLAIVGESGAGKSTLGRLCLGLEPCDEGIVTFSGEPISNRTDSEIRALRRRFQPVFQDPGESLNPMLRIESIVAEPLRAHKICGRYEQRQKVAELLSVVGLPASAASRRPSEFSAGQRQRIAIARALATAPELLILDEAVSSLDPPIRAAIIELLLRLQTEHTLAMMVITHDLATARRLCRRTAVMFAGRIIEIGPSEIVLFRPAHPYTRSLLEAEPTWESGIPTPPEKAESGLAEKGPESCCYLPRCPEAVESCSSSPKLARLGDEHSVACWLRQD